MSIFQLWKLRFNWRRYVKLAAVGLNERGFTLYATALRGEEDVHLWNLNTFCCHEVTNQALVDGTVSEIRWYQINADYWPLLREIRYLAPETSRTS